jgi:hypothetical protein
VQRRGESTRGGLRLVVEGRVAPLRALRPVRVLLSLQKAHMRTLVYMTTRRLLADALHVLLCSLPCSRLSPAALVLAPLQALRSSAQPNGCTSTLAPLHPGGLEGAPLHEAADSDGTQTPQ